MINLSSKLLLCFLFVLFAKGFILYDEEFVIIICLFIVFFVLVELSKDFFTKTIKENIFQIQKFYINELSFYNYLNFLILLELNEIYFFKMKFWCSYSFYISQFVFSLVYLRQSFTLYLNLLVNEKLCNFLLNESFLYYKLLNNYKVNSFISKVKQIVLNKKMSTINFENFSLLINK